MVFCPSGLNQRPFKKIQWPKIRIFDTPSGCTTMTEDWIFPASKEYKFKVTLKTSLAPSLNITFSMRNGIVHGFQKLALLTRNDVTQLAVGYKWTRPSSQ